MKTRRVKVIKCDLFDFKFEFTYLNTFIILKRN